MAAQPPVSSAEALDGFSPATRAWFEGAFAVPTQAQAQAWRAMARATHAGRRAYRVGEDAGRVPVGDRQARRDAAARRQEAALPGAVRLAAEGARGGHRAEPALPADRDQAGVAPARAARARHRRRDPHRGHRGRRTAQAREPPAGHPDHHAGVVVPAAHLQGQGDTARGRDGDRRRGARRGGQQAGRAPGTVARTARRAARPGRRGLPAADDGAAGRSGSGCRRPSGRPRRSPRSLAAPARSRSCSRPARSASSSRWSSLSRT